ncbi:uncharacterized protein LOC6726509 [Drosophila simulans]|uniref:uncharacterized protein LOC6726509 n=1 Tax=Drosophila simulans TaxID=7240 RepID=UPI00078AEE59|nr:uncharacterized protein LOC6726509 [Drosophila simulans]KMY86965.1 uncharacterized protein Dsimw501_GD15546 [Drosophila simulans]
MSENLDAEAEATGSDEVLTTGDPEQPSGSEEGSQSSDSEEENDSEAFQRLEEQLKDMERWIAQKREKRRILFIRLMNLYLVVLEARIYLQDM